MSPLPLTGPAGRTLFVCVVVSLLLGLAPGAALGVDAPVESDRPGETAPGGRVLGTDGAGSLVDLFDPGDDGEGDGGDDGSEEDEDEAEEENEDEDEEDDEGDEGEEREEHEGEGEGEGEGEDEDESEGEGEDEDERNPDDREGDRDDERAGASDGDPTEEETGVDGPVGAVLTELIGTPDDDASREASSSGSGSVETQNGGDGDRTPEGGGDLPGVTPAPQVETSTAGSGNGTPLATGTPSGTTEPPAPARLRVENVSTNRSTVIEGDPVRITATVVNAGGRTGTRDVRLHLFGEVVDVQSVTVPGGDARRVSFVREITAPGTYRAAVGNATTVVTVEAEETGTEAGTYPEPSSQGTPGFTALAALLGVLGAVVLSRRLA